MDEEDLIAFEAHPRIDGLGAAPTYLLGGQTG
jgi:hypothetical protein